MTLVAMSASYGARGSQIGPALAERLGVPFLDRAIPLQVAQQLDVPVNEAEAHYEADSAGWLERILESFVASDSGVPTPMPAEMLTSEEFRRATEEVLVRQAATGEGVILGRGAIVVLRADSRVLRVRLDGPPARRRRIAMELGGIDEESADRAMQKADRTHAAYMKRFYGARLEDPSLYHLMLDATALDLDACVEIIALAATALRAT